MRDAVTGTSCWFVSYLKMSSILTLTSCFALTTCHWETPELLSELPIEKLLLKKRSVLSELGSCNSSNVPETAALVRPMDHIQFRGNPIDRGHYEEPEEDEEDWEWMPMAKGKGLGQIFDKSVTALAFLAFGGYLVCLIIHAVKNKSDDITVNNATRLQQLLLNYQRPPTVPLMNLRPGRRRRDLMRFDPILMELIETGFSFAEAFASQLN